MKILIIELMFLLFNKESFFQYLGVFWVLGSLILVLLCGVYSLLVIFQPFTYASTYQLPRFSPVAYASRLVPFQQSSFHPYNSFQLLRCSFFASSIQLNTPVFLFHVMTINSRPLFGNGPDFQLSRHLLSLNMTPPLYQSEQTEEDLVQH